MTICGQFYLKHLSGIKLYNTKSGQKMLGGGFQYWPNVFTFTPDHG